MDAAAGTKASVKSAWMTTVTWTKPVTIAGFAIITKPTRIICSAPTRLWYGITRANSTPHWISVECVAGTSRLPRDTQSVINVHLEHLAGMDPGFATTRSQRPTLTTLTPQINAGHATHVQLASTQTTPAAAPVWTVLSAPTPTPPPKQFARHAARI